MDSTIKKKKKKTARTSAAYIDDYISLCSDFPLVKIETKAEYAKASKMIERLAVMDENTMSRAQLDYLDVLVDLYEEAERKFYGPELDALEARLAAITGVEMLRYIAEQRGLSGGDIGRILGSRQLGNAILRGDRQISKANAVKLAEHFKLDAGVFL